MIFEHSRFEIWNKLQHPYKHALTDFFYANGAAPGVSNVEDAMNYLFAVIYPKYTGTSATPADLPLGTDNPNPGDVAPELNDYRVVQDDGDGKAAGYRYEKREGDVSAKWYKIYDVDWSTDGILAALMDVTQDLYVYQKGKTDLDENGDPVVGVFAGQRVWGGNLTGQNLTLDANFEDGTGYVQVNNDFRPVVGDSYDIGTIAEPFKDAYISNSALIDDITISSGLITSGTGEISFDDEDLITTGNVTASILEATDGVDSLVIDQDSITATGGLISFDDENLSGTGNLSFADGTFSGSVLINSDIEISSGLITSLSGQISFDNENLITTGNITGAIITGDELVIDNININNNLISVSNIDGDLELLANGNGVVDVQSSMITLDIDSVGDVTIAGSLSVDNISIDGNEISSFAGDIDLISTTEIINVTGDILPSVDGIYDLGAIGSRFLDLFLQNSINDGTNEYLISDLMELRNSNFRDLARTQPAQNGDSLFYDSTNNVWLASKPDTEINHNELSNLTVGDSGHTQFVMLAGRSGGQLIQGGVAASENLTLESTADVTKGSVITKDNFLPFDDNALDLGSSSFFFKDLYTKGEAKNLRLENFTSGTLPASSALNTGRVVYATDNNKAYVDTGSQFKVLGVSKYVNDEAFDGVQLIKDVDVSAEITDARNAIIQLLDNSNDFERIIATIKATSASNVRIQTNVPLASGSYRLIVME
jgi:hypothetical protein